MLESMTMGSRPSPPLDQGALSGVLAEIAETAAETLELQEVFELVATAIRRLIPLDHMGVVRILEGQWAVLHAATVSCQEAEEDGEERPLCCSLEDRTPEP